MKTKNSHFRRIFKEFTLRLIVICSCGFLICTGVIIYPVIDGWLYYRTGWEIVQGLARLSLIAIALGAIAGFVIVTLAAVSTVLLRKTASLANVLRQIQRVLVVLMAFAILSLFLRNVIRWFDIIGIDIETLWKYGIWLVFLGLFVGMLWKRDRRIKTIAAGNRLFASKITRRSIIALGGTSTAVWAMGRVLADNVSATANVPRLGKTNAHRPNILLVTFDALNAEDMSLYGHRLPTTPYIDRFSERATTFRQFYACSTYTTPCVVAFSSGRYPSNTHVYHLNGRLHDQNRIRTLPSVLHMAGYETAASIANSAAHPDICGISGYDIAPAPAVRDDLQRTLFDLGEADILVDEAGLLEIVNRQSNRAHAFMHSGIKRSCPPEDSFVQAKWLWQKLRGPKFLHVHVVAPHAPYLPSAAYYGRFFKPDDEIGNIQLDQYLTILAQQYPPQNQPIYDKARLRYDEWLCEADTAFGNFMTEMEEHGELKNTIVAVSADHGESFQGGYYSHGGPNMLRSIIHVPLIVRVPGQTEKRDVSFVADAASLAPTLLDLAGISVPPWMDGVSLRGQMEHPRHTDNGFAFTQYLERNSAFKPITKGTIGVVDGEYQYIVDLSSGQGCLYELSNAHLHNNEISAQRPDVARALRERIRARFADIAVSA